MAYLALSQLAVSFTGYGLYTLFASLFSESTADSHCHAASTYFQGTFE